MIKLQGVTEEDLEYWREQIHFVDVVTQILLNSDTPFKEERDKAVERLKNDRETYKGLYKEDMNKMFLQQNGHRRHFYKEL